MKSLLLSFIVMLSAVSGFASEEKELNLEGRQFGKVKYDNEKRQVGLLMKKVEGEKDAYYGIVLEYLNPFKEEDFISNFFMAGKKGYLQELLKWIRIYKFKKSGDLTYAAYSLSVEDGQVVASESPEGSVLTVRGKDRKPLKNAVLKTEVEGKSIEMVFKRKTRFPLKSTWETRYTPGPYNPGYKQAEVDILELKRDYNDETKTATAVFDVEELKGEPLVIKGTFDMTELQDGLFVFSDKGINTQGADKVEGKIGVFIDVYNFQPIMNTFELILIDPADPKGSQMYFEEFGNED